MNVTYVSKATYVWCGIRVKNQRFTRARAFQKLPTFSRPHGFQVLHICTLGATPYKVGISHWCDLIAQPNSTRKGITYYIKVFKGRLGSKLDAVVMENHCQFDGCRNEAKKGHQFCRVHKPVSSALPPTGSRAIIVSSRSSLLHNGMETACF